MSTLKSVKSLCYRALRGAPLTPRARRRSQSSSPEPFSILVTELFHRDYSALFIRFVSQPRSPQPSSVHVFSSVLRPRHLNHPPSSSPEPSSVPFPLPSFIIVSLLRPPSSFSALFTGFVSGTVLHPRHLNHPPSRLRYRSPSSFSALFTRFVSETVLHPRLRNRPPFPFSAALFFWGCY